MSQLNVNKNAVQPDQIYFDLTTTNFQSLTQAPNPFYFNEQRSNPIIMNPEDYYLSIIRFTVDSGTLPVFIPSIVPNSSSLNQTIYTTTISWEGLNGTYSSQVSVIWDPQDRAASIPSIPSQNALKVQDNSTGYYNCYSYQYFCYLVLVALREAFQNMRTDALNAGETLPSNNPPIINWDSTANRAVLYVDEAGYDINMLDGAVQPIRIYFNAPLYGLFSSFPARYFGFNVTNGENYALLPANVGSTNLITILPEAPATQYTAIIFNQEWSTTASWTPITALVFTSNTLPVQPSQVSQPLVYNNGVLVNSGGNNGAVSNVITDIVSDTGLYAPNLVYLPQAQYRYITLYGNQPLSNLDISIYYRLKTGELIPFRLQSGGCVTMKLAFIKRSSIGVK
jgi:hypothetical protein